MARGLLFLVFSLTLGYAAGNVVQDAKLAQCGGEIDGDSDVFEYPGPGEALAPGEVCVWTIHLSTLRNFRFDFTLFNISSGSNETCDDGGVRLYSLTNLVPEGGPEGYSFCNSKAPTEPFYLGNNVAVLVLYTSITNFQPGTGFRVSFAGTSADPFRTEHISSFSSALEGAIIYPISGSYEANLAATWLVKTITTAQGSRSDISLNSVSLEPCANPNDACTCDALLIYEVSLDGLLSESMRFCEDTTSVQLSNVESRFIVAFFSDFESVDSNTTGFSIFYEPTTAQTSPTPTTIATTTTIPTTTTTIRTTTDGTTYPTPCGTLIEVERSGYISHKAGEAYSPNERCVWTVRIPRASRFYFTLGESGISSSDLNDGISISTFTRSDSALVQTQFIREEQATANMSGSVAVITFVSNGAVEGTGFVLQFYANEFTGIGISDNSTDFISTSPTGALVYPEPERLEYDNNELATMVISTPDFSVDSSPRISVTWTRLGLEGNCYDVVLMYKFYPDPNSSGGWSFFDTYCATSPRTTTHTDPILYVFRSDGSGTSTGFQLDWTTE